MTRTLVIILSETRAHELTYESFAKNVLDELKADLCVSIGVRPGYDFENPFYKNAKYKFTYDEPDDYKDAFIEAFHTLGVPNEWEKFYHIGNECLGGMKPYIGSGGISTFYRWFTLHNLQKNGLIDAYDRFVITRSDYMYVKPHPQMHELDPAYLWIPDCCHYLNGYNDRHIVASRENVHICLNIINTMAFNPDTFFQVMRYNTRNVELLLRKNIEFQNGQVRMMKPFMYTIRARNGPTSWSVGVYDEKKGYYIKYEEEYEAAIKDSTM